MTVIGRSLLVRELCYLTAWLSDERSGNPRLFIIRLRRLSVQCLGWPRHESFETSSAPSPPFAARIIRATDFIASVHPMRTPCPPPIENSRSRSAVHFVNVARNFSTRSLFIRRLNFGFPHNGKKQWNICVSA